MRWYRRSHYCVSTELSMAKISAFVKGAAMRRVFWTLAHPVPEGPFQILHLPHGSHELATLSLFAGKQHT